MSNFIAMIKRMAFVLAFLVSAGIVGLVLMVFAGFFHRKIPSRDTQTQRATAGPVVMQTAVRMVVQPRVESATGTIKPVHESNIASKILARVVDMQASAGKQVQAGDVLIRLSDEDLIARLRQAEADRDAARAQWELAKTEAQRAQQLLPSRSISQSDYETAMARLRTDEANHERAMRSVDEAKVVLEYSVIVAPFTGVVIDKRVDRGDTVTPGQVLLTLYDPTQMQLVASVRESLAMQLKVGQVIPAGMDSLGYQCQATIREIVPQANSLSRSFEVKVTGPCPTGIYSGMYGRIQIPIGEEHILLIPASYVQRVGQLSMVYVLEDGIPKRRAIQLGRAFSEEVEVLSGLQVGENVAVLGSPAKGIE